MGKRRAVGDKAVTISVLWRSGPVGGTVEIRHGRLASARATGRSGTSHGGSFSFPAGASPRMIVGVADASLAAGADATLVSIRMGYPLRSRIHNR